MGGVHVRVAHTADLDAATLAAARALLDEVFAGELDDHDWEHALGGLHALAYDAGDATLVGHASPCSAACCTAAVRCARATSRRWACAPTAGVAAGAALMAALERVVRGAYDLGALGASARRALLRGARLGRWRGPPSALTPDGIRRTADEDGASSSCRAAALDLSRRADVRLARRRRLVTRAGGAVAVPGDRQPDGQALAPSSSLPTISPSPGSVCQPAVRTPWPPAARGPWPARPARRRTARRPSRATAPASARSAPRAARPCGAARRGPERAAAVGPRPEQHRLPERRDHRDVLLEVELRDVGEQEPDHRVGQRPAVERAHEPLAVGAGLDVARVVRKHRSPCRTGSRTSA